MAGISQCTARMTIMQLLLVEDFLAQDMFSSNESKGDPFSTRAPLRSVWGSNQKAAFYLRRDGLDWEQIRVIFFTKVEHNWEIMVKISQKVPKLTRLYDSLRLLWYPVIFFERPG